MGTGDRSFNFCKDKNQCIINLINLAINFLSWQTGVVTYTITRSNPSSSESVTITITSKPVRGVEGINVDFRTESTDVSFTSTTLVRAGGIMNIWFFCLCDLLDWDHYSVGLLAVPCLNLKAGQHYKVENSAKWCCDILKGQGCFTIKLFYMKSVKKSEKLIHWNPIVIGQSSTIVKENIVRSVYKYEFPIIFR